MAWDQCDKCGKRTSTRDMVTVCVSPRSHFDPAEYESYCQRPSCKLPPERDEAYERANARYRETHGGEL